MEHDPVNHPKHDTAHASGVECIEITEHLNFCVGNAVKYLWRSDLKNGQEDLKKARWYLERQMMLMRERGTVLLFNPDVVRHLSRRVINNEPEQTPLREMMYLLNAQHLSSTGLAVVVAIIDELVDD